MKIRRRQFSLWVALLVTTMLMSVLLLLFLPSKSSARLLQSYPNSVSNIAQDLMRPMESEACVALAKRDFSGIPDAPTGIFSTQVVASSSQNPEYCDVKGYVTPQVQFEVRLPTKNWNRRYLQAGCGGYCGVLTALPESTEALKRNFAVAFSNSGHVGGGGETGAGSALWGLDQPQLRADFGYRSEHVTALAAKTIISAFYGKSPSYSYYHGCSNGGRQGLMEAQRYPKDFNGIIAGAPAAIQAPLNGEYETWNAITNLDPQDNAILTSDKLTLLHDAAIANCDGKDGLVDGQITDPRVCTFKPESLSCPNNRNQSNCLTAAQVAVVKKLYSGVVDGNGKLLYPGAKTIGSELDWTGWSVKKPGMGLITVGIADNYLKYLAFPKSPPASYSYKDWKFNAEGFDSLRPLGKVYNATNPNLKAFYKHGGKIIFHHGWSDSAIPPLGTIAYYQAVQDTMGGLKATQQFARLFMIPGMYHCLGGTNPSRFDMLSPIVAWVEKGTPVDKIIASQTAGDASGDGFSSSTNGTTSSNERIVRTRPIFPYPMQARYNGKGSVDDAANFVGIMPSQLVDDHINWIGNDLFQPK
ncbi:MAG: tannase/feruloyl esterase family alpha/beta hydrolase [Scytonematopsis contorta HA4267-MV1]|nr:tannase/feruloyl esterase family alpha/beta hydrolase [Scytonematopsis contorta HA4267-MV1]